MGRVPTRRQCVARAGAASGLLLAHRGYTRGTTDHPREREWERKGERERKKKGRERRKNHKHKQTSGIDLKFWSF